MKSWTVYKHISPNGKVYVGISSNVKRRWTANGYYYHLSDTIFSRALNKYGWDNFQHIIVKEGLTKREACDIEIELIAYYKAKGISYNITEGGLGYKGKHSETHIKHRIKSRIDNSTEEYLVIDKDFNYVVCSTEKEAAEFLNGVQSNISHVLRQPIGYTFRKHYIWRHKKGTPVDIEAIKSKILAALAIRKQKQSDLAKANIDKLVGGSKKELMSLSKEEKDKRYKNKRHAKGWHHSEETKKKLSEKGKGRDMSKAHQARKQKPYLPTHTKPVVQFLITGELVKEYSSITQASKETGTSKTGINNCLAGRSNSSGGFMWQYKN